MSADNRGGEREQQNNPANDQRGRNTRERRGGRHSIGRRRHKRAISGRGRIGGQAGRRDDKHRQHDEPENSSRPA